MNWLDLAVGLILLTSIISGFRQGLIRIGIGFVALILGFFAASWMYGTASGMLQPYLVSRQLSNILGFLMVFAAVLVAGAIVSTIIGRFFKLIGLGWADRLLGGVFGFVQGMLVCVIMVMVMLAFAPGSTNAAVANSRSAPYIVGASKVLSAVTPHEIKEGVLDGYDRVHKIWKDTLKKRDKKKKEDDGEKL